ncbi:MAG: DUF502 domain-containing protein [Phycisphaerae bacterium]
MAETFWKDFKRFFFRGLAAVLPTVLTIAIIVYVVKLIYNYVGRYINDGLLTVVKWVWLLYESPEPGQLANLEARIEYFNGIWKQYFVWVGFILAMVGIYIIGRLLGSFFGRSLAKLLNRLLLRLPLVKQVYPSVKQVTDFMFSEKRIDFSRVVAVEYPRRGIYSLGLVTGPGLRTVVDSTGTELLTVFIPSSPTPVTGYTIIIRRDEVIDLPITIDEALRYTISGGVVLPVSQQFTTAELEQMRSGILPQPKRKESLP